jgi:type IV secretory pathway TraG/TraD family ATPase VirD4
MMQGDDLAQPLLPLTDSDFFTVRDACSGVQIWGGTGSGKTSGSGRALALAYLRAGFGGLVLAAKSDVVDEWREYARAAGRSGELLVIDDSGKHRFNFLDYELRRPGAGRGLTANLVRLFVTVYEGLSRQDAGGGNDPYWMRAMMQLLRNAIDLAAIATGTVSVPLLHEIVMSAPISLAQVVDERWQQSSKCYELINTAGHKMGALDEWTNYDLRSVASYFMQEFPSLADRTRSSVISTFTSMADAFLRRPFRQLFCSTTTYVPELSHQGIIIVLNLPVKLYGEAGRAVQMMFKYMWQQALERRNVRENPRPCFLWADESQNFVSEYDMQFQTTARSSRGCTVYLTQNVNNYYAEMGGKDSRARVNSLIGNFMTQIFHANADADTNTLAAEMIGRSWQVHDTRNWGGSLDSANIGGSQSLSYDYDVIPQKFTQLRKGGPENDLQVDAIAFQSGRIWSQNGRTFLPLTFQQK